MNVFALMARISVNRTKFDADLRAAERSAQGSAKRLGGTFGSMGRIAMRGAAVGVSALVGLAAAGGKAASDLEAGMANVATLLDDNGDRIDQLTGDVKRLSIETGKPLGDLTDGLYQVVSAFGDSADTAELLRINAMAATAGIATTTDAINLTSAVTKGYGDTSAEAAQKASDLAFQAVKLGQTTFPELASSMGRVVPLAATLGVSQEELFAVMATGTGVTGNAAEVSTQLRGVLQSLMAPTKDMSELLADLGYESGQALIEQEGLQGAIEIVTQAAEDSGTPLQKYMSSIEGQTLALTLAGNQSDVYAEKLAAMIDAQGATREAFGKQMGTTRALAAQVRQLGVVFLVSIGERVLPLVNQLLGWVVKHAPEIQDGITSAMDAIGAAFSAVGAVVAWLRGVFDRELTDTADAGEGAASGVAGAWTELRDTLTAVTDALVALWTRVLRPAWEGIRPLVEGVLGAVVDMFRADLRAIREFAEALVAFLNGDWAEGWRHVKAAVGAIMEGLTQAVVSILSGLIDSLRTIGTQILGGLVEGINSSLGNVKDAITGAGDRMVGWFKDKLGIHSPSRVFAELGGWVIAGLTRGLQDESRLEELRTAGENAAQRLVDAVAAILGGPDTPDGKAQALGAGFMQGLAQGIRDHWPEVDGALQWLQGKVDAYNLVPNVRTPTGGSGYVPPRVGDGQPYGRLEPVVPAPIGLPGGSSSGDTLAEAIGRGVGAALRPFLRAPAPRLGEPGSTPYVPPLAQPSSGSVGGAPAPLGPRNAYPQRGAGPREPGTTYTPPHLAPTTGPDPIVPGPLGPNSSSGPGFFAKTAKAAGDAAQQLGTSLVGLAKDRIPIVGTALEGLTQGGPVGAVVAVFTELLSRSEAFQGIIGRVNDLLEPIIETLGGLLDALYPLIDTVLTLIQVGLMPVTWLLENVIAPVFRFVANAIAFVWNGIANAINAVLGWLGVHLPTVQLGGNAPRNGGGGRGSGDGGSSTGGRQVSEITGPTRDLLVSLLTPLASLPTLEGYLANIYGVLDRRLPNLGGQGGALAGAGGVVFQPGAVVIHAPDGSTAQGLADLLEHTLADRLYNRQRSR